MTPVLHTAGTEQSFECATGFRTYLDRLEFARVSLELVSASKGLESRRESGATEGPMLGFLIHSLLGVGLRQTACLLKGRCGMRCERAHECASGRILCCEGRGRSAPLALVSRLPAPYRIDADWRKWRPGEPMRTSIWLFGAAAQRAGVVSDALAAAASAGVGRARTPMFMQSATVTVHRLSAYVQSADTAGESGACTVRVTLRSPLRLMRGGRPLRTFSLPHFVQNLNLRLAVWGYYHQGLPWAPRWAFLDADARAARVIDEGTRWEDRVRYSSRQRRLIRTGGLTGSLVADNVSPALQMLLRVGEVLGVGKGGTIGLGCVEVNPTQRTEE